MQFIPFRIFKATNIVFLLLISVLISCDAIFEDDISSDEIELTSPANNASTAIQTQTFEWEQLNEANEYRIQIVSPSFANPSNMELDSILTGTSIAQNLIPGVYQWRVKGINSSSETSYSVRTLTIENSEGLASQIVVSTSPVSDSFLSSSNVTFEWIELEGADSYLIRFETDIDNGPGDLIAIENVVSSGSQIQVEEGVYWWKVAGEDGTSTNSQYSTSKKLTIDQTSPTVPTLTAPVNGEIIFASTYVFSWEYGADINPSHDIFEVSQFENFSSTTESIQLTSSSQLIDFTNYVSGTYFWRIETFDLAGNSTMSQTESFFVQ